MRRNDKAFKIKIKLWVCFGLYAAIIFVTLWLLQVVFLQKFYNKMVIQNVKKVAKQIKTQESQNDLEEVIDEAALQHSLLIFLTDSQGNVLYNADEHNSVYEKYENSNKTEKDTEKNITENTEENATENITENTDENTDTKSALKEDTKTDQNPYFDSEEPMNWQLGAFRNLPQDYTKFLEQLLKSKDGTIGYTTKDDAAYVYGTKLSVSERNKWSDKGELILYISTQLGAVGAATNILRVQLVWVTILSLLIGFFIAYFFSRQFAKPISAISTQAKRMAVGEFEGEYERGFCQELDELSDTLKETATTLHQLENTRRELLANISHDLRTPLTMIKGYAEMVRDISWNDDEKREEDLMIIINESDRLTRLVNDILEYSSVQSAQYTVEFQAISISNLTKQVADQFAPLCEKKNIVIETEIQENQWVKGDQKLIERVLYNLIDNAICHSTDREDNRKGVIQVRVKEKEHTVLVEVQDYGKGIPKEELPYIWDRYFTSKKREKNKKKSGLGLAITKEILLKQKANFGVESEDGCLFWFELKKFEIKKEEER